MAGDEDQGQGHPNGAKMVRSSTLERLAVQLSEMAEKKRRRREEMERERELRNQESARRKQTHHQLVSQEESPLLETSGIRTNSERFSVAGDPESAREGDKAFAAPPPPGDPYLPNRQSTGSANANANASANANANPDQPDPPSHEQKRKRKKKSDKEKDQAVAAPREPDEAPTGPAIPSHPRDSKNMRPDDAGNRQSKREKQHKRETLERRRERERNSISEGSGPLTGPPAVLKSGASMSFLLSDGGGVANVPLQRPPKEKKRKERKLEPVSDVENNGNRREAFQQRLKNNNQGSIRRGLSSFGASMRQSAAARYNAMLGEDGGPPPFVKNTSRMIGAVTQVPKGMHGNRMQQNATMRRSQSRAAQAQMRAQFGAHGDEVFRQMAEFQTHPVRFIWFVTVLQVVVFGLSMYEGGVATWGVGYDTHKQDVYMFNNQNVSQDVLDIKNMWYGPHTDTIVHYGAKYTPCMREEPVFTEKVSNYTRDEASFGCCIDSRNECGQMDEGLCSSFGGEWTAAGVLCSDILEFSRCEAITLHPCCYYIANDCVVTSEAHCSVLPQPRTFHPNAELCSQVNCAEGICGMGSLGSLDGATPNQWWRFITPIFMHVGVGHLGMNMLYQVVAGGDLESVAGFWKTALMYMLSGIGGNVIASFLAPMSVSAGASSSLYGIIGVQLVDFLQSWRLVKGRYAQLFRMLFELVLVLGIGTFPWVDNFAHAGGFIVGVACGFAFLPYIHFSKSDKLLKWFLTVQSRTTLFFFFTVIVVLFYSIKDPEFCTWCKYVNCVPYFDGLCDDI